MINMYDNVIKSVKEKLLQFLRENKRMFFNERDLQVYLTLKLEKTGDFDEVFLEYHLPKGFNKKFDDGYADWQTETPSIDIVLKIKGAEKYIAIELKNKLKAIKSTYSRFGQIENDILLVKNQSAQNIGRYQFWKDVKRLELLKESYENVIGGIALFLTNDTNYLNTTKGADYEAFSMTDRIATGYLDWKQPNKINKNGKITKKLPSIRLSNEHTPEWEKEIFKIQENHFHCCTVLVL